MGGRGRESVPDRVARIARRQRGPHGGKRPLGQAATGIRETADELIAALRAVTNERIAEAAQSMTLDTVYFLTGEDSKDE